MKFEDLTDKEKEILLVKCKIRCKNNCKACLEVNKQLPDITGDNSFCEECKFNLYIEKDFSGCIVDRPDFITNANDYYCINYIPYFADTDLKDLQSQIEDQDLQDLQRRIEDQEFQDEEFGIDYTKTDIVYDEMKEGN